MDKRDCLAFLEFLRKNQGKLPEPGPADRPHVVTDEAARRWLEIHDGFSDETKACVTHLIDKVRRRK